MASEAVMDIEKLEQALVFAGMVARVRLLPETEAVMQGEVAVTEKR